jgi:acyl-CoA synthetase (AMP-forming)/AMP-acid ligase II
MNTMRRSPEASEHMPLLRGFEADDPVLLPAPGEHAAPVGAARFCAAARRLARTLPRTRYAINRCEDPAAFMLGSAAALLAGQTLVLPFARNDAARRALHARYADSCTLVDAAGPLPPDGERWAAGAGVDHPPGHRNGDAAAAQSAADFERAGDEVAVDMAALLRHGDVSWPPPMIDAGHEAAILFTSGTTGTPTAQPKTWSALVRGARTFAQAFGALPPEAAVLGTVAPQHMFGLETTLLVPWQSGVPLSCARPLYPADLAAAAEALAAGGRKAWLMTTPLHLRAFHAALASSPPPLARIIVSTMPLAPALATEVERDFHVPVLEVYGCTEGGLLATRRPAQDVLFTPAPGLAYALDDEGRATVTGGQLDAPLQLGDRFRSLPDTPRLLLTGRSGDIVKIAGRRSTLAELSAALQSVPGVRDAAYVLPHADAPRLCALVVAPAHDALSLRRALATRVDPAFLPRPFVFVASLPRDAHGKLPAQALHDALAQAPRGHGARPDRTLACQCTIDATHPSLPGHFPGRPLGPGVLLLERIEGLLRRHAVAIAALTAAKFLRVVRPGEPLRLRVILGEDSTARFDIDAGDARAVSGTLRWRRAEPEADAGELRPSPDRGGMA